jgi:hypothetical protein
MNIDHLPVKIAQDSEIEKLIHPSQARRWMCSAEQKSQIEFATRQVLCESL